MDKKFPVEDFPLDIENGKVSEVLGTSTLRLVWGCSDYYEGGTI